MSYSTTLKGLGNPDYCQYTDIAKPQNIVADTIDGLVLQARQYIEENDLGGGNWNNPRIANDKGEDCGYIAYNGRVFNT